MDCDDVARAVAVDVANSLLVSASARWCPLRDATRSTTTGCSPRTARCAEKWCRGRRPPSTTPSPLPTPRSSSTCPGTVVARATTATPAMTAPRSGENRGPSCFATCSRSTSARAIDAVDRRDGSKWPPPATPSPEFSPIRASDRDRLRRNESLPLRSSRFRSCGQPEWLLRYWARAARALRCVGAVRAAAAGGRSCVLVAPIACG